MALDHDGRSLYFGGDVGSVGILTGCAVVVDTDNGRIVDPPARLARQTDAAVPDGLGGWYVAHSVPRASRSNVAFLSHLDRHGRATALPIRVDGQVLCMIRLGHALVIGGRFQTVNDVRRSRVAMVDPGTGGVSDWNPDVIGDVHALAIDANDVVVAGSFLTVAGQPRRHVARVRMDGTLDPWAPWPDLPVLSVVIDGDGVLLGGHFLRVNEVSQPLVARVDRVTGELTAWRPSFPEVNIESMWIRSLVVHEEAIYLAGNFTFTSADGESRHAAAAFDRSGHLLPWDPRLSRGNGSAILSTLAADAEGLFLGGIFDMVGDSPQAFAAKVDARVGAAIPWSPRTDEQVHVIAVSQGRALVGGAFQMAGPRWSQSDAMGRVDLASDRFDAWSRGPSGTAWAIEVHEGRVHAGGAFDVEGTHRRLVTLDAATGEVLHMGVDVDGLVTDLARIGDTLFLAGWFTRVAGSPRLGLAAIDLTTGSLLDWAPDPDGDVDALVVSGNTLYVGGWFRTIAGDARPFAAAFAADGALLPWTPVLDGPVRRIAVGDAGVYLAGAFMNVGFQPRAGLALVDAAYGHRQPWRADLDRADVEALAVADDGSVIVAGGFSTVGGEARQGLARLDGTTGAVDPWAPVLDGRVWALQPLKGSIAIGGAFRQVDGVLRGGLVQVPLSNERRPKVTSLSPAVTGGALVSNVQFVPSPLDRSGVLHLTLQTPATTSIDLFDLGGRHVRSVLSRRRLEAGTHAFAIDPADLSPGAYWCRIDVDGAVTARKVVVVH